MFEQATYHLLPITSSHYVWDNLAISLAFPELFLSRHDLLLKNERRKTWCILKISTSLK